MRQAKVELLDHLTTPSLVKAVRRDLARAYDSEGDVANAITQYNELYLLDTEDVQTASALTRLLVATESWAELGQLLEGQANRAPTTERKLKYLLDLAALYRDRLGRQSDAITILERGTKLAPQRTDVLEALADLCAETNDLPKHVEVLERIRDLPITSAADRVRLQQQIADLFRKHLELPHRAIDAYQELLRLSPTNANAVMQLATLYRDHGLTDDLIALFDQYNVPTTDGEARSHLLALANELGLRGKHGAQIKALQHARELTPKDTSVDLLLAKALVRDDHAEQAISILNSRIADPSVSDPIRAQWLLSAAQIHAEPLKQYTEARRCIDRLARVDTVSAEVLNDAQSLCATIGYWAAYIDITSTLAGRLSLPAAKATMLVAAATKLMDIEPSVSKRFFTDAFALDDSSIVAIDGLLSLSNTSERLSLLEIKRDLLTNPEELALVNVSLARLQANQPTAEQHLRSALEMDSRCYQATLDLAKLLIERSDLGDAASILDQALSEIEKGSAADGKNQELIADMMCILADIRSREGDSDSAQRLLIEAQRVAPDSADVRLALGEFHLLDRRFHEALRQFRLAEAHPQISKNPHLSAETAYKIGICEQRLRNPDRARRSFERVLEFDEHHDAALIALIEHALSGNDILEASNLMRRRAHSQSDLATKVNLLHESANLLMNSVNFSTEGTVVWREILDLLCKWDHENPSSALLSQEQEATLTTDLVEHVMPVLLRKKDIVPLIDAVEWLCARDVTHTHHGALRVLAARVAITEDQKIDSAKKLISDHLAQTPNDLPALDLLTRILMAEKDDRLLTQLLRPLLSRATEPKQPLKQADAHILSQLIHRLGLAHRRLDELDQAIAAFEVAARLEDDIDSRIQLRELYAAKNMHRIEVTKNHQFLARDIAQIESVRHVAATAVRHAPDHAYCIYNALKTIGQLDRQGQAFLSEHRFQERRSTQPSSDIPLLTETDRTSFLDPAERKQVGLFNPILRLAWFEGPLSRLHELDDFNVQPENRVSPVDGTRLADNYSIIARQLGIKRTALYRVRNPVQPIRVLPTTPTAIAIAVDADEPNATNRLSDVALRFALARHLELSRPPQVLAEAIEPATFSEHVTNLIRAFHPRYVDQTSLPSDLYNRARQIRGEFSYTARQMLQDLFRSNPDAAFDSSRWRRSVHQLANRIGLLICGDVGVAAEYVRRHQGQEADTPLTLESVKKRPAFD